MNSDQNILRENNRENNKERLILFKCGIFLSMLVIAAAMVMTGYLIKQGMIYFKNAERTVTVKGIAEREVKSDLAVWNLSFRNGGDELSQINNKMAEDRRIIIDFFKNLGFEAKEIQKGEMEVIDKLAREYGDRTDSVNRYIVKDGFVVRTDKIELVLKALSQLSVIIEKGVIISGTPAFYYTKFFLHRLLCQIIYL